MKKFAPLFIAAAALGSLQACSTETATTGELSAEDQAATCANPEGTNAAIAALATAITQELHRWQISTDFYVYNGYNSQQMLGLTSAGLAACGNDCFFTKNILAMQDSRMDQKVVFDGTKLSSWSFASRLVTGYGNQKACQQGGRCPFPAHVFAYNTATGQYDGVTTAPGACDTLFTFNVNQPAAQNHAPLTSAQMAQLNNALVWTTGNGPNPYIAFQSTASTVSIDPNGQLNPPGQNTGAEVCQKASRTSLLGTPCTCATFNVTNGTLKNDDPLTPATYFCRQI
jgi:hypothetical protein